MKLNIAGRIFDTEEIIEATIREDNREVFITTEEDFFRIKYRSAEQISDLYFWKRMANVTVKDLHNAIYLLTMTCDYFINSKEQCHGCPLYKNDICLLLTIPNNWRL